MTKRFTGEFDKQYSGVHDNGEQLTNFEVVDLLNDLIEENEQLRKDATTLIYANQDYRHENENLKKENENFKKALRIVYSTKLTEPTKHTIEQIAKHCRVDLE